ncbi:MAG: hypothetical protein IJE05_04515 [Clostridia bacterium]|nr:hypothetical protein [Clostridia bacterium]
MRDGKFIREKYINILEGDIEEINLNLLNHESGSFIIDDKINGYDVSYLAVRYLIETLSKEKFNKLIRNNEKIVETGKIVYKELLKYFNSPL